MIVHMNAKEVLNWFFGEFTTANTQPHLERNTDGISISQIVGKSDCKRADKS